MKRIIYLGTLLLGIVCLASCSSKPKVEEIKEIEITEKLAEAVREYDYLGNFHEGLAIVRKGFYWGFINANGKEIIPCKYASLVGDFSEGLAYVGKGFINTKGKQIIPLHLYDNGYSCGFHEGLAVVKKDGKFGYINIKGKEVIPCIYDYAYDFHDGLARVRKDSKSYVENNVFKGEIYDIEYGFINTKGEEVIPCKYKYIEVEDFSEGLAVVRNKEGQYGYINTKGEEVISCKYYEAHSFHEGLAVVERDKVINMDGEIIFQGYYIDDFSEGLAAVSTYGYINTTGETVIPCKYDYLGKFHEGLAMVVNKEKNGYINTKGEEVIPCKYDFASDFSEGLAVVYLETKDDQIIWGYVDKHGNSTFTESDFEKANVNRRIDTIDTLEL